MSFKNISEVKKANRAVGHYWFDPKTIAYHGSKVETRIIGGHYWVESSWADVADVWDYNHSTIDSDPSRYNLGRVFRAVAADPNGVISYLSGGDKFDTLAEAKAYIDAIVEGR